MATKAFTDTSGTLPIQITLAGPALEAFQIVRGRIVAARPDSSPTDLAVITEALKWTEASISATESHVPLDHLVRHLETAPDNHQPHSQENPK